MECFHVLTPCPSLSKFNIVPMVTGTLMGRMVFRSILPGTISTMLTLTATVMATGTALKRVNRPLQNQVNVCDT